jgi:hypothetical protein
MRPVIVRIIEENVDGCGSDAIVYVRFACIDPEETTDFKALLAEIKSSTGSHLTEELVSDALARFDRETGIYGKLCDAPYDYEISF